MFGFVLVLPLMIIIAAGNILRSRGFYSSSDISVLTKTLYWVILPVLLFRTTFISGREVLSQPNLLLAVNVCYIITIMLAWVCAALFFHRGNSKRIAVSVLSSIRANNIYLGFPVVQLAMGEAGLHEASVYIAVSTISFQLLSLMSAEVALSKKLSISGLIEVIKKLAVNPLVISCGGGILIALTGLKELPLVLDEAMRLIGEAATAVALLALGGTLNIPDIKGVIRILRSTWCDCLVKLLVHPLLMWGLLIILPVPKPLLQATVMLSSMPAAVNCFILAKEIDMDGDYAADLVASTTVLGIISIPFWAALLGLV